ncbi:hypothetical protein ACLFKT_36740, partial [Paraburkholderia sp. BR14261]
MAGRPPIARAVPPKGAAGVAGPADSVSGATASAADALDDDARDARYANPFAPPDEAEAAAEARPRSLFGEILDWMLAPLLLL